MTCPHAHRLGAYALGVEDPDREAIERHLSTCESCAKELADLTQVTSFLAVVRTAGVRIDEESAAARGSPKLLERVLLTMQSEKSERVKRRRRLLTRAAALAAAAAFVVGVVSAAIGLRDHIMSDRVQLTAVSSSYGVDATTTVQPEAWGTRVTMSLQDLPPVKSCKLVARSHDGRVETIASWRAGYGGGVDVEAMTAFRPDELAQLEVVDDTGRRLLTVRRE
ncbi:MAG TPA: zf-HC2 domain-containing protein [Actinopolymorphaceae bacterium]|jgi:hypothetical protein